MYARKVGLSSNKLTKLRIVANKKAENSILGIIKVSDNSFNPGLLKDKLFEEWGNAISIAGWKKEYPIKLRLLEANKAPIEIEILEGNQIDIYTRYDIDRATLDEQLKSIENVIERVYVLITEESQNVKLKISPITLSYQHKVITKSQAQLKRATLAVRRNRDAHILILLKDALAEKIDQEFDSLREVKIVVRGQSSNLGTIDTNGMPVMLSISNAIGNSFVSRARLNCTQTVMFTSDSVHNQLQEKSRMAILKAANVQAFSIPDLLWETMTMEEIEDKDYQLLLNIFKEYIGNDFREEVAIGVQEE